MLTNARKADTPSIGRHLMYSFESANAFHDPYPHWLLSHVFPDDVVTSLVGLPFDPPQLAISGTREVNNASRQYFDSRNMCAFEVMRELARIFQSRRVVTVIEQTFGTSLAQSFLRIEYAMDTDGFWLEPHTDIGPKRFTMLVYLSREIGAYFGTDLYYDKATHSRSVPYASNTALVFVPSARTWHGLEKKPIEGVRRSIIINYVSADFRSREQLCFPDTPVY
jgi:hypothetical protein